MVRNIKSATRASSFEVVHEYLQVRFHIPFSHWIHACLWKLQNQALTIMANNSARYFHVANTLRLQTSPQLFYSRTPWWAEIFLVNTMNFFPLAFMIFMLVKFKNVAFVGKQRFLKMCDREESNFTVAWYLRLTSINNTFGKSEVDFMHATITYYLILPSSRCFGWVYVAVSNVTWTFWDRLLHCQRLWGKFNLLLHEFGCAENNVFRVLNIFRIVKFTVL